MAAVQVDDETQRLFDLCPDLLSVTGFDGYLDPAEGRLLWSPGTHRIHGTDQDTFDPHLHDALAFYPEEAGRQLVAALERLERDGTPYDLELSEEGIADSTRTGGSPTPTAGSRRRSASPARPGSGSSRPRRGSRDPVGTPPAT